MYKTIARAVTRTATHTRNQGFCPLRKGPIFGSLFDEFWNGSHLKPVVLEYVKYKADA